MNTGRTGGAAATRADPTEDPALLPARRNCSPEAKERRQKHSGKNNGWKLCIPDENYKATDRSKNSTKCKHKKHDKNAAGPSVITAEKCDQEEILAAAGGTFSTEQTIGALCRGRAAPVLSRTEKSVPLLPRTGQKPEGDKDNPNTKIRKLSSPAFQ